MQVVNINSRCFIIWSNKIEGRLDPHFYKPDFSLLEDKTKWSMAKLETVCNIEKGTSITKTKVSEGKIPVIAGGQQPAYYHNHSNREGKTITISASGAYAGFVNYFDFPIFASDCTTIKSKDENKLLSEFIFFILKSKQKDIYKLQRGAGQPHVYGKELAKIAIPVPPLEIQNKVVEIMQSAYDKKVAKEQETKNILNSIDDYILGELNIKLSQIIDKKCFVINASELKGILSPLFFTSQPQNTKNFIELYKIAEINPKRTAGKLNLNDLVPYVGLPETDNLKIRNILKRPYKEVRGRNIINEGDILFARIEPSIFNKKYIFADSLRGDKFAFTSTEFYIVKAKKNVNSKFLFYMFFTNAVYSQVLGRTTGSTGRRRLDKNTFGNLLIPFPNKKIQNKLAVEIEKRMTQIKKLKLEAKSEIEKAKQEVEKIILGKSL